MTATGAGGGRGPPPPKLAQAIEVGLVTGGEPTNPLWSSEVDNEAFEAALRQSLHIAGMLAATGVPGRYRLDAHLVGLDQPGMGLSLTVTSTVRYDVGPTADGAPFNTTVIAAYTATPSDAFNAVTRLRIANEGAMRNNIGEFLDQLSAKYAD